MSAVRCVDLCKTYRQGEEDIKALDHLSIEIVEGGFVCLSAPSGGGKTTLLNAIGGLDRPDSGEVYIAGRRIDTLSKGELADVRSWMGERLAVHKMPARWYLFEELKRTARGKLNRAEIARQCRSREP